ncbi:hypothetical protein K435DRAFT_800144 [Dendrothele bispora CBS 962.96]|uniref:Ubiquitin-like protease family profile domain-containing protein n=1 Tax=Dendrothele bispora (strain CBS 962.96) TaxID=1314807 RepID=A0A4S8LUR9_DENBC|nr:hypothetical protein K435DRAFT_800144 [Dendrothele bispora CBS 962.96]
MQEEVDSMPALEAHQQTRGEKLVATKKTIQNFQHATGIQLNLTTAKKIWNNEYKSFISELQTGKEFNTERLERFFDVIGYEESNHWIMAVADFEEQFIEVYDSLPSKTAQHQDIFQVFKTCILAGVNDSLNGEIFDEYFSRWKLQPQPQVLSVIKDGAVEATASDKNNMVTRLKTNEDSGGTKYLEKTKQPGEVDHHKTNQRSSCLKGEKTQAQVKASTKYAHLPVEKWGAGGYSFVPITSEFSGSDMNNSD